MVKFSPNRSAALKKSVTFQMLLKHDYLYLLSQKKRSNPGKRYKEESH